MQKAIILSSIMVLALILNGCAQKNKDEKPNDLTANNELKSEQKAADNLNGDMAINLERSVISWKGSMLFNFGEHYGTLLLKQGEITFADNKIVGGNFTADMNTIWNTDGDYNKNLIDHLKNEDFFEVSKFPESSLEITGIEYVDETRMKLDANLTIKNIKRPIEIFKADYDREAHTLTAKFKIDRSEWGINYNAKGVAKVKNHAISDAIAIEAIIYLDTK